MQLIDCTTVCDRATDLHPPTIHAASYVSGYSQMRHIPSFLCISGRTGVKMPSRRHRGSSQCVHRCHQWQICPPTANQQPDDPYSADRSINHVTLDRPWRRPWHERLALL
ncbi:hypothetical protein TcWFU_009852 [Taenia crassiceps]|uniref:Uncharacterized protein n=1 Tax=Taenia crassiceps TaxID=6207 RepID=A0ABR4PZE4_9CEST